MNRRKSLVIVPLIVLVVLFAVLFKTEVYNSPLATLTIDVVPSISQITIDSQSVHAGVHKVAPGTHKIVVSLTGFTTITQTETIRVGDNKYVGLALTSNSAETANWYQAHPSDAQKLAIITGKNFDAITQQAASNVPLIKKLPYIGAGFEFRIDYGNPPLGGNPADPAIYIQAATPQGQQDALTWIKNQGYDISKLQIVYQNTSPQ